jgi:hypothetical protein
MVVAHPTLIAPRQMITKIPVGLPFQLLLALLVVSVSHAQDTLKPQKSVLWESQEGRELLQYVISCALREDQATPFGQADASRSFQGSLGLAPDWTRRAPTLSEKQLVSACLLARTNYFGVPVQLSLRSEHSDIPGLQSTPTEKQKFSRHEATFFGNILDEPPQAFVCAGDTNSDRSEWLEGLRRVCSIHHKDGLTPCGFTFVGACHPRIFLQGGADYTATAIQVFLPHQKARAGRPPATKKKDLSP